MTCQEVRALQHAYSDGELDVLRSIEMEEHLRTCPNCLRVCENLRTLKAAFKSPALYFHAPSQLKRQIAAASHPAKSRPTGRLFAWSWMSLAIPASVTAVILLTMILIPSRPSAEARVVQEITASHIRSLMPNHLMDVASTDQHTVKPWFAGKLDFSPRVVDLSARGFALTGGRLDYLENRPVAALVYERRKHIINMFTWPVTDGQTDQAATATARQGYNLVRWRQAGMVYWAASDLNARELLEFVQALQSTR
jgi:anti-sigma factor RsiW